MSSPSPDRHDDAKIAEIADVFSAGGDVGRNLAAVDWAATPLGPPEHWPRSLTAVVRILLGSRFSMWMAWGPELTFFCNDAYRRDTLGAKYPWALGKPAYEVWAEIWPDIGPRIEQVMSTGVATWDEALLLFLERSGFPEETYHTFSYSPLWDDEARIMGMLCVVSEDTERVVNERRMATLRELGSDPTAVRTEAEVFAAGRRALAADPFNLPFTLAYTFEEDGTTARLVSTTGFVHEHPVAPPELRLDDVDAIWPAAELAEGRTATVSGLAVRFPDLPTGAWEVPPQQALVVPLPQQGSTRPLGFLVAGLNQHRPLDDGYEGFVNLIAGQLAAGVTSARAYEAERHRAERLAELDRAKTTFFTNVSHEFRTPLTLLLGPAEDALADEESPLDPAQRLRVEVMHRNAQRLLKLVNTLLDFSRLESGRLSAWFEPVDLAVYTEELANAFSTATQRVGLELTVHCEPLGEPVYIDREQWAKIVLNLLSNALKFTFSGGIDVRLGVEDGRATLRVTDTGIGIDEVEQAHLFERFHRVTGARSRTHEGSGIGLALVAELAALHGGTVSVSSTPGTGSTFVVQVPFGAAHLPPDQIRTAPSEAATDVSRAAEGFIAEASRWLEGQSSEPAPTTDAAPAEPEPAAEIAPRPRPRVLVVDDNADMREYVTSLLSPGYEVESASDGAAGLAKATARPPDLILTDVMMPKLDGFQLLEALRADAATSAVPVVMLSARAGEEATIEGLDAGADDYLVKPFSARELLARVRANLELDRVRRTRAQLEQSQALLDQAQRLARVGSWELDVATQLLTGSREFYRQLAIDPEDIDGRELAAVIRNRAHPEDAGIAEAALSRAIATGEPFSYEVRVVLPDGSVRRHHTIGEVQRDETGRPVRLRGSNQDVTDLRRAEEALAQAAAAREAAAREHRIADELQRSLLPAPTFDPDHLRVATYYQAGVAGTQVGGDWYDVIELGAGRTALVMGDVMGRGVRAAAVMGQLRAAVRAYARLDLQPADILEFLDGLVRDLGNDQIVTCVYAVYDPGDSSLSYANAGHLPPVLRLPGEAPQLLTGAAGPPLGTGVVTVMGEKVTLPVGTLLTLYTDGLVEHRHTDLDSGIDRLAEQLVRTAEPIEKLPQRLVDSLLPDGQDDDVAVLVAEVHGRARETRSAARHIDAQEDRAVQHARGFVSERLRNWAVSQERVDDVVLLVSELVTNAVIHGRPPIELRLRCAADHLVLEVQDGANYLPRKLRPTPDDEHGRGLQLVSMLTERWGTRPTPDGKALWAVVPLSGELTDQGEPD